MATEEDNEKDNQVVCGKTPDEWVQYIEFGAVDVSLNIFTYKQLYLGLM